MSAFVDQARARYGVEPVCRTLGVSVSAYYQRATGERSARGVEDERLIARIREVHEENFECYGYPRVWHELKRQGEDYKVVNGLGEFFFEIRADRESGVIDMLAGPHEQALQLFPTRVVPLGDGGSAFTFTMFQAPGQPDEQFEGQYHSLVREFENLELLFS